VNWQALGRGGDDRTYGVTHDPKGRLTLFVESPPGYDCDWIALQRVETLKEAADTVADVAGAPFFFHVTTIPVDTQL